MDAQILKTTALLITICRRSVGPTPWVKNSRDQEDYGDKCEGKPQTAALVISRFPAHPCKPDRPGERQDGSERRTDVIDGYRKVGSARQGPQPTGDARAEPEYQHAAADQEDAEQVARQVYAGSDVYGHHADHPDEQRVQYRQQQRRFRDKTEIKIGQYPECGHQGQYG
jgi:hypothetical protein